MKRLSLAALLATLSIQVLCTGLCSAQVPAPAFTDVTAAVGIDSTYIPTTFQHSIYGGGGAVGDFNNDGVQEIFLMRGAHAGLADQLYVRQLDGTYQDQAAQWGLAAVHNGKGVTVGDYNNDGFLDMYVTSAGAANMSMTGKHKLYKNNGNGTFTDVAAAAGVDFTATLVQDGWGAAFGDYDLDGDLDLFVAGFSANNHGTRIFKNNGNGTFTDVTVQIGFFNGTPLSISAFAPRFADMDGDRYPELLLAGDFGTERYYRNNTDGTFTDFTAQSGCGQSENAMGGTIGDWNGDGLLDWYVTNIHLLPTWDGNKLYENQGGHSYSEVAGVTQTDDGGYAWGAVGVDFNHDGRMDIAQTNGDTVTGEQSYLFMKVQGQVAFNEMALQSGFVHTDLGRGMFNFDMDNDGDQDILIVTFNGPAKLFRNDIAGLPNANWLRLFFDTSGNDDLAPNGYGTKATVTIGPQEVMRYMAGGDNFLSCSELSTHFGLSTVTVVDKLEVEWSDGQVTTILNVPTNQTMTIVAPPNIVQGSAYCFGDGTGTPCPCGASGNAGEGCQNTTGVRGAEMTAAGKAHIGNDSFRLYIQGVPGNKPGLLLRGMNQLNGGLGNPVGDGLLCTGGQTARSHVQVTVAGDTVFNDFQGNPFGASSFGAGAQVNYQFWYRDPMNPCSGSGFNFANAWGVIWQP
jgi:enediyne biosynthesis protein E4